MIVNINNIFDKHIIDKHPVSNKIVMTIETNVPIQIEPSIDDNNEEIDNNTTSNNNNINNIGRRTSHNLTLRGLVQTLEKILSFHAYCSGGHPYQWNDNFSEIAMPHKKLSFDTILEREKYIRIQIRELIHMITTRLPRDTGFGWKIKKIHELLHIPTNLTSFGSTTNFNAGPG